MEFSTLSLVTGVVVHLSSRISSSQGSLVSWIAGIFYHLKATKEIFHSPVRMVTHQKIYNNKLRPPVLRECVGRNHREEQYFWEVSLKN